MKTILILLTLLLVLNANSQISFQKTFGNYTHEGLNDICKTLDGGYAAVGYHRDDFITGPRDRLLFTKFNSNGDLIASKWFNTQSFFQTQRGVSVIQTADSGFAILSNQPGRNLYYDAAFSVIKLDKLLNIKWVTTIGNEGTVGSKLIQTLDGGYAVVGNTQYLRDTSRNGAAVVCKISSTGNIEWLRKLRPVNSGGYDIVQDDDGNYIVAGFLGELPSNPSSFQGLGVIKLNAAGNPIASKRLFSLSIGYSIAKTRDNGFIVSGNTYIVNNGSIHGSSFYIAKFNSLLEVQWSKVIPKEYSGLTKTYVTPYHNGTFLMIGSDEIRNPRSDIQVFVHFDNNGKVLTTRRLTGAVVNSVIPSADSTSTYTFAGYFQLDNTSGVAPDLLLAKVNGFNSLCGMDTIVRTSSTLSNFQTVASYSDSIQLNGIMNYDAGTDTRTFSPGNFCGSVLPSKLLTFSVTARGDKNILQWTTEGEINLSHFEIERSGNGINFTTISKATAGLSSYTFTDDKPLSGQNYYRLKMMDKDGKFEYSAVRMIDNRSNLSLNLYPLPAKGTLNIQIQGSKKEKANVIITDMTGKTIIKTSLQLLAGLNITSIDIQRLIKGLYFLKVVTSEAVESKKIVVL